jgi:type I restriction enzyme S subunit
MYSLREIAPPAPAVTTPVDEKVWLLNLDQIEPHTGTLLSKEYVERSGLGNSTHAFDDGNVLYSKLRPYLNKVLLPDIAGYCTSELVPMRPNQAVVTREYLAAYLRSPSFLNWVSQQVDGAKMPRVSMKVMWEHRIELPTLDEQKRITSILDKAESLRRKRQEAIRRTDELLRALFIDMYGDPSKNPKGWPVLRMGDVIDFKGGSQPPKDHFIDEPRPGYVRLVQIRDFKTDRYKTYIPECLAKRSFEVDDVMIARYGPPVFQILRGLSGSYNVALMKAQPRQNALPEFIFWMLQLPKYQQARRA